MRVKPFANESIFSGQVMVSIFRFILLWQAIPCVQSCSCTFCVPLVHVLKRRRGWSKDEPSRQKELRNRENILDVPLTQSFYTLTGCTCTYTTSKLDEVQKPRTQILQNEKKSKGNKNKSGKIQSGLPEKLLPCYKIDELQYERDPS